MRIVLVVIDSGGIGDAPDAALFGDLGANTIGHALAAAPAPLPHLAALGLQRLTPLAGTPEHTPLAGAAVRLHPLAAGKDTLAGHWEMMGQIVTTPFPTYPDGFPPRVARRLEAVFGRPFLGNRAASGTEIIDELGPQHLKTGRPIVYTSADSVLQIAAHEEVVPLDTLYRWCQAVRAVMRGPDQVGRIIARPFVGTPGHFQRTAHRHDYAVEPDRGIFTESLADSGVEMTAIGKIWDIFAGRGFSVPHPTTSNADGLEATGAALRAAGPRSFIFTNLVDFDSRWGHRRDAPGYVTGLVELDAWIPTLCAHLGAEDQLWITADHGCDPTRPGSDHTREDSPWLLAGPQVAPGVPAPGRTLADIAATLAEGFGLPPPAHGRSIWKEVTRHGSQ